MVPPPNYGGTAWADGSEEEKNSRSAGTEDGGVNGEKGGEPVEDISAEPVMGKMAENDGFFDVPRGGAERRTPEENGGGPGGYASGSRETTGIGGLADGLAKKRYDAEDLILVSLLMALLGADGDDMTTLLLILLFA